MKKTIKIFIFSLLISIIMIPAITSAQSDVPTEGSYIGFEEEGSFNDSSNDSRILNRMKNIANQGGYATDRENASAPRIVGLIINALLSITGIIFIILTVFAGFNWMTSEGNEEKIKKSKDTLKASIIGLIVTLSAWTIWNFIFQNLILGIN